MSSWMEGFLQGGALVGMAMCIPLMWAWFNGYHQGREEVREMVEGATEELLPEAILSRRAHSPTMAPEENPRGTVLKPATVDLEGLLGRE